MTFGDPPPSLMQIAFSHLTVTLMCESCVLQVTDKLQESVSESTVSSTADTGSEEGIKLVRMLMKHHPAVYQHVRDSRTHLEL